MTVTVPPRAPASEDERTLDERIAELEAVIKEARRRARRRRAVYAVVAVVALAGAIAGSVGIGAEDVNIVASVAGGSPVSVVYSAPEGNWSPTRGPNGGAVSVLALDPSDPGTLYSGGSGGVFKSTDAGETWRSVTAGRSWTLVTALAVDPTRTGTVYVATDRGVGKTTNGGRAWKDVNNGLFDGLAPEERSFPRGLVSQVLVDPSRPGTVYLPTWRGLFRTTNAGARWRLVGPPEVRGSRGFSTGTAIDLGGSGTIYASWGSSEDLYKSTDGADTWQRIGKGPYSRFGWLTADPRRTGTLYAGGPWQSRGLWKSDDGGATWRDLGFAKGHVDWVGVDPGSRSTVFTIAHLRRPWTKPAAYASYDDGVTWRRLGQKASLTCCPAGDPRNPHTLYGGGSDGPVKSLDAGRTWHAVKTGYVSTDVDALVLAPGSPGTLYAGNREGVQRSSDNGRSWRVAGGGNRPTTIESLAVEQRRGGAVYAGTRRFGLFKSADGGVSWRHLDSGPAVEQIEALAVDPRHPNTVYAGANPEGTYADADGRGVYKTVDGGATWRRCSLDSNVRALAIHPRDTDTLFAATSSGLFRSTDRGDNWERVASGGSQELQKLGIDSTGAGFQQVAIDPMNPDTVYAARVGSILKSIDGGDTWSTASSGLAKGYIDGLAVDPRNPHVLYVGGDGGVFRSADGARSWHRFERGLAGRHVRSFAVAPDGRTVFAGTLGRGVVGFRITG